MLIICLFSYDASVINQTQDYLESPLQKEKKVRCRSEKIEVSIDLNFYLVRQVKN
jgi:hypothetical protein